MARSSTAERGAAVAERRPPTVVIVGQIDEVFTKIYGALESQCVHVAQEPVKDLSSRLDRRQSSSAAAPDVYLFNLVGTPFQYDWRELVKRLTVCEPRAGIVLAFDKPGRETIEAAIQAGADDFLWRAELPAFAIVWKRIRDLISRAEEFLPPREVVETRSAAPTDEAKREALARVHRGLTTLPTVEERRAPLVDVLGIAAPRLRARSGRLDATKIAERLDVPIARLASAVGVSRQALSQTPDSPNVQNALDPFARALDLLDHVLSPDDQRKWLQSAHSRLDSATPIDAMLGGRAEAVARMLESVRNGGVD